MEGNYKVAIVVPPFCSVEYPCLEAGLMLDACKKSGANAELIDLTLDFAKRVGLKSYRNISEKQRVLGLGEFAGGEYLRSLFTDSSSSNRSRYFDFLRENAGYCENGIREVFEVSSYSSAYVDSLLKYFDFTKYDLFLFTCKYQQLAFALSIVHKLKSSNIDKPCYLFGEMVNSLDASCSIVENFTFVDGVFPNNANSLVAHNIDNLLNKRTFPGLVVQGEAFSRQAQLPQEHNCSISSYKPDYATYYFDNELEPIATILPYQSSAGCWWADKITCSFCGLVEEGRNYTSKQWDTVLDELIELTNTYEAMHIVTSDLLLDYKYIPTLFAKLHELDVDITFFYELKASISKAELASIYDAGVTHVQVGIESLSSATLKGMHKGTTALQNIRFLKWCAEIGINVSWIHLYGFIDDDEAGLEKQIELMKKLYHLQPAIAVTEVRVERNSPMHLNPERYGLEITGPDIPSACTYPLPDSEIAKFSREFSFNRVKGFNASDEVINKLKQQVFKWRSQWHSNTLYYRKGFDFVKICDFRNGEEGEVITIKGWRSKAFLIMDDIVTINTIERHLTSCGFDTQTGELEDFLNTLLAHNIVVNEGSKWLSLVPRVDKKYLTRLSIENRANTLRTHMA